MPRVGKESPRSLADLSPPPGNERKELPAAAFGRAATYAFHWDFSYARGRSLARIEMMKYFMFTEIHKQCLNQLSGPSWDGSQRSVEESIE